MNQFLIEIDLPAEPGQLFWDKIQEQRNKVNELMNRKKLISYSLSQDRQKLWCIMNAAHEFEVMELLAEFPLIDYMKPSIFPLMFHNSINLGIPAFSVN